jgi:Domain of unknown function (DUF4352)
MLAALGGAVVVLAVLGQLTKHPGAPTTSGVAGGTPTGAGTSRASGPAAKPTVRRTPAREPGVLIAGRVGPAQDRDVVFTLTDLRCGLTSVGRGAQAQDEPAGRRACAARVVVRNTGAEKRWLPPQTLHDAEGGSYGSNGFLAARYGRKAVELRVLEPGESVASTLVWELPTGVRPVDVEFRGDLIFSLGTRRSLR